MYAIKDSIIHFPMIPYFQNEFILKVMALKLN